MLPQRQVSNGGVPIRTKWHRPVVAPIALPMRTAQIVQCGRARDELVGYA